MVGFPTHIAEKYAQTLNSNGYLVAFFEDNKEQQAVEKTFYEYALTIVSKVVNDESYINACLNSDKDNAKLECDAAVKRAILAFSSKNRPELYKMYFDMPEFQERIHNYSFEQTYDIIRENEMDVPITDEPQQAQAQQDESYTEWVKSVISEYLEEEENTTADFSNMREVNILYTFADETILHLDESHTLRVDADLIDFKINRYIDDILIDSRPFEEFLDDLSMLNFGEMVGFSDEQIKQVKEKDNIQEPTENYSEYIGREITVDGSKFIVDSISAEFGSVSLRDATFQEKAGYPIFRGESIEWLKISFRSRLKRRRNYHRRTYKDRSLFRIPLYILKYHSQSVITLLSPMMNSVTVRQVKNTRRMLRLYGRSNRLKQNTVWQLLKNRKHYHGMSVGAVLQTVSRKTQ